MAEDIETINEEPSSKASEESAGSAAFFTPEAFLMFSLAGILDLIGISLLLVGLDDFGITDIIGSLTIGLWSYLRSRKAKVTYQAGQTLTKAAKWAKRLRWLRPLLIILEWIPFLGAAPCWVLIVYFELQT